VDSRAWTARPEVTAEFVEILGERVAAAPELAPQRPSGPLVAAGSSSQAEVDPAGIERLQRYELLGDHQRGVVGQHDSTGPNPDRGRAPGNVGNDHGRRGAGDPGQVVVLGDPVPMVTPPLGMASQVECVVECLGRRSPLADGGEIENRKRNLGERLHGDLDWDG